MNSRTGHGVIAHFQNLLAVAGLRDRVFVVARGVCVVVAVSMIGLFLAAIPARFDQLVTLTSLPEEIDPATLHANLDAAGLSLEIYALHRVTMEVAFALVCISLGALIFWRRPNDRMAVFTALLLVLLGTTFWYTLQALTGFNPIVQAVISLLDVLGFMLLFVSLFLFPDGRFVPKWTGWLTAGLVAGIGLGMVFPDSPLNPDNFPVPVFLLFILGWLVTGAYAQYYRYRYVSGLVQRQQIKWIGFGISVAVLGFLLMIVIGEIIFSLAEPGTVSEMIASSAMTMFMALIPTSIGVAILRHRLFEIDSLINRTLVYGGLTVCVVSLYVLIVGYLGELLRNDRSLLVSLAATGVVAVAFAPLRDYFQRSVNRLMYGDRDDPYEVVTRLGARLEEAFAPEAVLPTIVDTVREALRLPYVAIALGSELTQAPAASSGTPVTDPIRLPLMYQNQQVGELLLARRSGEDELSPADSHLLSDLVRQAGVAVHAVRLTADLQRSRQHLVTAREEERRRLRRDLHDGVGPRLAAMVMKLETARGRLIGVPDADDLLDDIVGQVRYAVGDIRRAVYALRPPALDELGLVPALSENVTRNSSDELLFTLECPSALPMLPAAVEVAAYLIVQEAITNVIHHAGARTCVVHIQQDDDRGALEVRVVDDGCGHSEGQSLGVGLTSMRDRAEELGGTFAIQRRSEGGTCVKAVLPYSITGEGVDEGLGNESN
ncbi:MAG: histidine kinase [Thermomicrobiaceae bacterium]